MDNLSRWVESKIMFYLQLSQFRIMNFYSESNTAKNIKIS